MPTKTIRRLVATYEVYSYLTIPADLFLLPAEKGCSGAGNWEAKEYGSWYVRWDTLNYIDKNLKEQTLDLHAGGDGRKNPGTVEFEEYEEDIESDEEEETESDEEEEEESDEEEEEDYCNGCDTDVAASTMFNHDDINLCPECNKNKPELIPAGCECEDCEKKPETDDFRRFLAIIHPADE